MYGNRFRYACMYSAPCRKSPGGRNKRSQGTARCAGASISGLLLLGRCVRTAADGSAGTTWVPAGIRMTME